MWTNYGWFNSAFLLHGKFIIVSQSFYFVKIMETISVIKDSEQKPVETHEENKSEIIKSETSVENEDCRTAIIEQNITNESENNQSEKLVQKEGQEVIEITFSTKEDEDVIVLPLLSESEPENIQSEMSVQKDDHDVIQITISNEEEDVIVLPSESEPEIDQQEEDF